MALQHRTSAASVIYAAVRRITDAAAALAALSVLVSLALVCYSVGMRYVLNDPVPWVDEAIGYVLVASVMLAVAEALRKGEHIAVDILTDKLPARGKRIVQLFGLVAVIATAALLTYDGWDTAMFSRMLGIRSIGYLDVPIWIVQLLIPLGGLLLLLAALAGLVRALAGLPPEEDEAESIDDLALRHQPPGID